MATVLELIQKIEAGEYDQAFGHLYGTDKVEQQKSRYTKAVEEFGLLYGKDREVSLYSAPGRTEIGGNHVDHNNGVVMAAAVDLDIITVVSKNNDNTVRLKSQGFSQSYAIDLSITEPQESEMGSSSGLIRGVAMGIVQKGGKIGGFDAYATSDVLSGSGLSSSAAFEVVMGAIFVGEYNNDEIDQVEIAKISQYAENVYFGKPCGLMDQTACAVGGAITIDFKDPTQPIVNRVSFDLEKHGFVLCITDTKGSHADLTDDYAAIRSEMEQVAAFFGKKVLREVDEQEVFQNLSALREKLGDRACLRAIHFFAECHRAKDLYTAVEQDRFEDFLHHIIQGGHSSFEYNQNAYSIKNPKEQGVALGVAVSQHLLQGKGAWRLQGGGFAGTIQAFVPVELLDEYKREIENVFGEGSCYVLKVRNYGAVAVTPDM